MLEFGPAAGAHPRQKKECRPTTRPKMVPRSAFNKNLRLVLAKSLSTPCDAERRSLALYISCFKINLFSTRKSRLTHFES